MLPQQFASWSHLCFWNLLYNSHEFFVCDPANGTQENYMYVSTCRLKTSIYTNWTAPTFNFLDFSYFSLSLCPFSELLAARKTYLKSFWLIGSFQKANHVTVLSCLTSFQLQDTWTIKPACMLFANTVYTQQIRENGTFLQVSGTQGLQLLFQYLSWYRLVECVALVFPSETM